MSKQHSFENKIMPVEYYFQNNRRKMMKQTKKELMLYIGSCRYMHGYRWSYFPARLHTTKEIIFFLENIENIENIINKNPNDLTNLIFGDVYHPAVKINSQKFIINYKNNYNISEIYKEFILEISSRKIYYFNDIPLNYYYTNRKQSIIKKYKLKKKILSNDEIEQDLKYIVKLLKNFHPSAKINIIPHLNLKLKSTQQYIQKRNELVNLLGDLCIKLNLKYHNIGKYIEHNISSNVFLEDYMKDGRHYSSNYNLVKKFLETRIYLE